MEDRRSEGRQMRPDSRDHENPNGMIGGGQLVPYQPPEEMMNYGTMGPGGMGGPGHYPPPFHPHMQGPPPPEMGMGMGMPWGMPPPGPPGPYPFHPPPPPAFDDDALLRKGKKNKKKHKRSRSMEGMMMGPPPHMMGMPPPGMFPFPPGAPPPFPPHFPPPPPPHQQGPTVVEAEGEGDGENEDGCPVVEQADSLALVPANGGHRELAEAMMMGPHMPPPMFYPPPPPPVFMPPPPPPLMQPPPPPLMSKVALEAQKAEKESKPKKHSTCYLLCCRGHTQVLWIIIGIILIGVVLGLVLGLTLV